MKLWVAGYGLPSAHSVAEICVEKGKEELLWKTQVDASSYLAHSGNLLFAISEWEKGSAVRLFTRSEKGFLERDMMQIPGGQLCHITYLPVSRVLLGACYGSGDVFSVEVNPDSGTFGRLLSYEKQGDGAECSLGCTRAHSILSNAAETIAVSANIALDRLYFYRLDAGKMQQAGFIQLPEGTGPRHFVWREDMHKIFAITEYSNEILVINLDNTGGKLLKRISTLQDDFEGKSYGSTLVFSPDSRYLYAGNRGEDTIAVFAVDADGNLRKAGHFPCGGCWPRDLALVDGGRFLAVANQKSNAVVLLPRNPETGALGNPVLNIPLNGASYVRDAQN